MKIRGIMRVVARGIGLIILFVVMLELCARIDDSLTWGAPFWGHYSYALLSTTDVLGPHSRFGASFENWCINSYGFRGPEITMEKPAGVVRVLVIGASETFGLYESPGKGFPAQMQHMLDVARPGRYQVLNAALVGMTLPRFIHYFHVWLWRFDPDIVVYYPTPASYLHREAPERKTVTRTGPPKKLPETIRLVRKTKTVLQRFIPASIMKWLRQRRIAWVLAGHERRYKSGWMWQHAPAERVGLFKEHLTALIKEVRASGARFVLATHANRFPADRKAWSETDEMMMAGWRRFVPRATGKCLLDMEHETNRVVVELGERLGVPVVDVATAVPSKPENFAHFTDRGAEIVAKALTTEILMLR